MFNLVQWWVNAGRRAEVSPDFWIGDEVDLPASLPMPSRPRTTPRKHVRAVLTAGDALHALLEESLGAVTAARPPPEKWAA